MTRDELEARLWKIAPKLCAADDPGKAMDAILRAAEAFARTEASHVLVAYRMEQATLLFPQDPPMVTAERRRQLEDALRGDPRTIRRRVA